MTSASASMFPELPDDYWHTFVYVNFGWLSCGKCDVEPDLRWAWPQGVEGEQAAVVFAIRAVEHLKAAGWIMHDDQPCCPECAAKLA